MKTDERKVAVGLAITILAGLGAGIFAWGLPAGFDKEMIGIGTSELVVAWLLYREYCKIGDSDEVQSSPSSTVDTNTAEPNL